MHISWYVLFFVSFMRLLWVLEFLIKSRQKGRKPFYAMSFK